MDIESMDYDMYEDQAASATISVNKLVKVNSPGLCPSARSGHRAVADENFMWVVGGYNPDTSDINGNENPSSPLFKELWRFNISTSRWMMMKCTGNMPSELASHSATIDGRFMLVFGGTGFPFGESSSNKLSACHLKTGQWSEVEGTGNLPEKKYGQAMILHRKNLVIFGGTTGFLYNSNLHKLNLKTRKWKKITPNNDFMDVPEERYRHEIALYDNHLYVIGGGTSTSVCSLQELPTFCLTINKWSSTMTKPDPCQSPGYPMSRRCHGCVQVEEEVFISGGYDGHKISDDVWKINVRSMQWTKIADMPEPVYFHSVAVTPDGCMFIFGGVSSIEPSVRTDSCYRIWLRLPNLQTLCWQKLLNSYPQLINLPRPKLLQLGIIRDFINKLPCPEGA